MAEWKLTLSILPETFAVCRLEQQAGIPTWATKGSFYSITRTPEEVSIVCPQDDVPDDVLAEKAWHCLKIEGPMNFSFTGVLASLARPLADAGVSIFALATYNTDYLLIKEQDMTRAALALTEEGHQILPDGAIENN
ncbi:MAG TPA: ACT domain-containing protein [Ktedonobacterales bacterium]|jgi:hypothetical protein